jgi:hypothetical protein
MNADNTLFSFRADVRISKQVYWFSLVFRFTLGTQKRNKTNVFSKYSNQYDSYTTCLAHRRTDVNPPLRCSLYRGFSRSLQNARCFVQFATLYVLQLSHVPSHVLLWLGSAATLRTFCTLSGGSKDSLLMSCYNKPTTHTAQYYRQTILMSLYMARLTVPESKAPRILVSWLMS